MGGIVLSKMGVSVAVVLLALSACSESRDEGPAPGETAGGMDGDAGEPTGGMDGDTAACKYSILTFKLPDGTLQEVDINGLPVHVLNGAKKVAKDKVEVLERRGVLMADILETGGIDVPEETRVNCVARDGYDPLRTKLKGDTSRLPTYAFFKAYAYVYLSYPGEKDPLYPEMEGLSLAVDYNLTEDSQVPAELGGKLVTLSMYRFKMVEKVDENRKGIFELGPVP